MNHFIALFAVMLLSACVQQPLVTAAEIPSITAPAAYSNAPAGKAPPPMTMAGDWDLLLLDNVEIEGKLHFKADDATIWFPPACARQERNYRIDGEQIALEPLDHGGKPVAVCRIGLPPQLAEVMAALDGVNTIQSAPAGAIRLYGGGNVVLLVPHLQPGE